MADGPRGRHAARRAHARVGVRRPVVGGPRVESAGRRRPPACVVAAARARGVDGGHQPGALSLRVARGRRPVVEPRRVVWFAAVALASAWRSSVAARVALDRAVASPSTGCRRRCSRSTCSGTSSIRRSRSSASPAYAAMRSVMRVASRRSRDVHADRRGGRDPDRHRFGHGRRTSPGGRRCQESAGGDRLVSRGVPADARLRRATCSAHRRGHGGGRAGRQPVQSARDPRVPPRNCPICCWRGGIPVSRRRVRRGWRRSPIWPRRRCGGCRTPRCSWARPSW